MWDFNIYAGDGIKKEIELISSFGECAVSQWYILAVVKNPELEIGEFLPRVSKIDSVLVEGVDYTFDPSSNTMRFTKAPEIGETIGIQFAFSIFDGEQT